ncbi:MAG TPA: R3H domain-containing nucleic acid-binding protein [Dehalococcoidia bacterium]|nr:R3H domain-containing nucleic acid-binding protein [Dehalococcoidia bacterium]
MTRQIVDDLEHLLRVLPDHVQEPLLRCPSNNELLEVVMDLGRPAEARYPGRDVTLTETDVAEADIEYVVSRISPFGDDNRAGIERTLHRISAIRNRRGRIVGLTLRVGRAIFDTIPLIEDLVRSEKSILLLGRPGVGKTTLLREVARVLADDLNKRVIVVDTSNEIGGDGDIPHPAIGSARRMQVPTPALQHDVMIEAVENHMPEVIIIDEIGTGLEAQAARTIAERGVQLVATAHGNTLDNLIANPTLMDLVGGIQAVTLGDEEARRRGTQKTVLERKAPPTFDVVVEIQSFSRVAVHPNVAETVDTILRGSTVEPEVRELDEEGDLRVVSAAEVRERRRLETQGRAIPLRGSPGPGGSGNRGSVVSGPQRRIFPFGLPKRRLQQAIRQTASPVTMVERLNDADTVLTLRSYYRRRPPAIREAEARGMPIRILKDASLAQIQQGVVALAGGTSSERPPVATALQEAQEASQRVLAYEPAVDLSPQNAYIRRLQHQLAQRYSLSSRSMGREPQRHVRIFREEEGSYTEDEEEL